MIPMPLVATSLLASLSGSEAAAEIETPEPVVVGGLAFAVLCLLLFLVTRLNRDR